MLSNLWGKSAPGGLLADALEEACGMLRREEGMFRAACDALASGKESAVDVVHEDEDIDLSERMVRRLVFEHLTVNPQQDLPTSLVLLSIVHDIERIGDYTKSLLHIGQWYRPAMGAGELEPEWHEIRTMIDPMFGDVLRALRDSDTDLAHAAMQTHREVKARAVDLIEEKVRRTDGDRRDIVSSMAAQFLRRVSAHLSNVASSIVNPFDRLGAEDET